MDFPPSQYTEMKNAFWPPDLGFQASIDFRFVLDEANQKMEDLGVGYFAYKDRLLSLHTRLQEGRFRYTVPGRFKSGKCALLKAFIKQELSPISVVVPTAIATLPQCGPEVSIRVVSRDEKAVNEFRGDSIEESLKRLQDFVAEKDKSKNRLGFQQVEILHPALILQHGVVPGDTPRIESAFTHNAEATLTFFEKALANRFVTIIGRRNTHISHVATICIRQAPGARVVLRTPSLSL